MTREGAAALYAAAVAFIQRDLGDSDNMGTVRINVTAQAGGENRTPFGGTKSAPHCDIEVETVDIGTDDTRRLAYSASTLADEAMIALGVAPHKPEPETREATDDERKPITGDYTALVNPQGNKHYDVHFARPADDPGGGITTTVHVPATALEGESSDEGATSFDIAERIARDWLGLDTWTCEHVVLVDPVPLAREQAERPDHPALDTDADACALPADLYTERVAGTDNTIESSEAQRVIAIRLAGNESIDAVRTAIKRTLEPSDDIAPAREPITHAMPPSFADEATQLGRDGWIARTDQTITVHAAIEGDAGRMYDALVRTLDGTAGQYDPHVITYNPAEHDGACTYLARNEAEATEVRDEVTRRTDTRPGDYDIQPLRGVPLGTSLGRTTLGRVEFGNAIRRVQRAHDSIGNAMLEAIKIEGTRIVNAQDVREGDEVLDVTGYHEVGRVVSSDSTHDARIIHYTHGGTRHVASKAPMRVRVRDEQGDDVIASGDTAYACPAEGCTYVASSLATLGDHRASVEH